MSNALAVATVTASLAQQVSRYISDGRDLYVPGAQVTFLSPASEQLQSGGPAVNIFLFRATRNPGMANDDLPSRGPGGGAIQRPQAAIDLDYLVTFFGDERQLEPQRLLGAVVAGLHAEPILSRATIQATVKATRWLTGSDLADQAESVRLTQVGMAPDQMARFWSEFVRTDYRLSLFYHAAVVLLDTPVSLTAAIPVRTVGVVASAGRAIVVWSIVNLDRPDLPIVGGGTMGLSGPELMSPDIDVVIGGSIVTSVTRDRIVGGGQIRVKLTPDIASGLSCGVNTVQLVRRTAIGRLSASAETPVIVVPAMPAGPVFDAGTRTVGASIVPPADPRERVILLLYPFAAQSPASYRIAATPDVPGAGSVFDVSGVDTGTYLCRIEVGDAEPVGTLLSVNETTGKFDGPLVTVTAPGS